MKQREEIFIIVAFLFLVLTLVAAFIGLLVDIHHEDSIEICQKRNLEIECENLCADGNYDSFGDIERCTQGLRGGHSKCFRCQCFKTTTKKYSVLNLDPNVVENVFKKCEITKR